MAERRKFQAASFETRGKPRGGQQPRAPRIPSNRTLRFRPVGQAEWCEGLTFDISQSGVLFRADRALDIHTPVEMTFSLPYEIAGKAETVIYCRGEVVRTIMPATSDGAPHLAAKILDDVFKTQPGETDLGPGVDDGHGHAAEN